jgi:hypothetical protein
LLPAFAVCGVQEATAVGPLVSVMQVMVELLVQDATGTACSVAAL